MAETWSEKTFLEYLKKNKSYIISFQLNIMERVAKQAPCLPLFLQE